MMKKSETPVKYIFFEKMRRSAKKYPNIWSHAVFKSSEK